MPEISVIIPVYKAESSLERCVGSILTQTYQNFDVILVDDGSPDNCPAMCDALAQKDSRIHVIHQQNAGVSVARNVGMDWALANSNSSWITFVDSDDWVHKNYLERLIAAANKPDVQLAICDMLWTKEHCQDEALVLAEPDVLEPEAAFVQHHEKSMSVCCKLIHKSLIGDVRFPPGKRYEDAAVGYLLMLTAGKVSFISEKLYYYYFNESSFTNSAWSETRLQCMEVHEQRMRYLCEHGYDRGYPCEVLVYIDRITENLFYLTDLLNLDEKYSIIFEQLREKLRSALKEARSLGVLHFGKEFLMPCAYACKFDIVWKTTRRVQRLWHKLS